MVAASSCRTPAFLTALGTAGKMPALLVFRVVIIVRCTVGGQVETGALCRGSPAFALGIPSLPPAWLSGTASEPPPCASLVHPLCIWTYNVNVPLPPQIGRAHV